MHLLRMNVKNCEMKLVSIKSTHCLETDKEDTFYEKRLGMQESGGKIGEKCIKLDRETVGD